MVPSSTLSTSAQPVCLKTPLTVYPSTPERPTVPVNQLPQKRHFPAGRDGERPVRRRPSHVPFVIPSLESLIAAEAAAAAAAAAGSSPVPTAPLLPAPDIRPDPNASAPFSTLASYAMCRSPGMRNLNFFTRAALNEDEKALKVADLARWSTPRRFGAVDDAACSSPELPHSPGSSSFVESDAASDSFSPATSFVSDSSDFFSSDEDDDDDDDDNNVDGSVECAAPFVARRVHGRFLRPDEVLVRPPAPALEMLQLSPSPRIKQREWAQTRPSWDGIAGDDQPRGLGFSV